MNGLNASAGWHQCGARGLDICGWGMSPRRGRCGRVWLPGDRVRSAGGHCPVNAHLSRRAREERIPACKFGAGRRRHSGQGLPRARIRCRRRGSRPGRLPQSGRLHLHEQSPQGLAVLKCMIWWGSPARGSMHAVQCAMPTRQARGGSAVGAYRCRPPTPGSAASRWTVEWPPALTHRCLRGRRVHGRLC